MRTQQQLFDVVATHLLTQGKRSDNAVNGQCLYRGKEGGLKCAIGILIPDEHYHPDMEGVNLLGLICAPIWKTLSQELQDELSYHRHFLAELQGIHDYVEPIAWRESLDAFATKHNLQKKE